MKKQSTKHAGMEKLFWKDVRDQVLKVNPDLTHLIDTLNPDKKFPLYLARYPYGTQMDDGQFNYPLPDGQLVKRDNPKLSEEIKKHFEYSGLINPIALILEKTVEFSWHFDKLSIPAFLYKPGMLIALTRFFQKRNSFNPYTMSMYSGARHIFMVPNIGDMEFHKHLQRNFGILTPAPRELPEHWEIFRELISANRETASWEVKLLLFTSSWIDHIMRDEKWSKLKIYCLNQAWLNLQSQQNKIYCDLAFSLAQRISNLKPDPYLADIVKHILAIGAGQAIGFSPAIDDSMAPVFIIQKIYMEHYRMRDHIPTIFEPTYFDSEQNRPIYFSLQHPTLSDFSPASRRGTTVISDLCNIKHILGKYLKALESRDLGIEKSTFGKLASSLEFDFFHIKQDTAGQVLPTSEMPLKDPALVQYTNSDNLTRSFAHAGEIVRGCIRISHKRS